MTFMEDLTSRGMPVQKDRADPQVAGLAFGDVVRIHAQLGHDEEAVVKGVGTSELPQQTAFQRQIVGAGNSRYKIFVDTSECVHIL